MKQFSFITNFFCNIVLYITNNINHSETFMSYNSYSNLVDFLKLFNSKLQYEYNIAVNIEIYDRLLKSSQEMKDNISIKVTNEQIGTLKLPCFDEIFEGSEFSTENTDFSYKDEALKFHMIQSHDNLFRYLISISK